MSGAGSGPDGRKGVRPWILLGSLLALGAAGAMVFTDDLRWLRLGIVAALWAALLGAFVATRNQKQARVSQQQVRDAQAVYELELEREVAARREHEVSVANEAHARVDSQTRDEVESLRGEVVALRDSLEQLMGGQLLYERVALTAESTRMRQLGEQDASPVAGTAYPAAGSDHATSGVQRALEPRGQQQPSAGETEVFRAVAEQEHDAAGDGGSARAPTAGTPGSGRSEAVPPHSGGARPRQPGQAPRPRWQAAAQSARPQPASQQRGVPQGPARTAAAGAHPQQAMSQSAYGPRPDVEREQRPDRQGQPAARSQSVAAQPPQAARRGGPAAEQSQHPTRQAQRPTQRAAQQRQRPVPGTAAGTSQPSDSRDADRGTRGAPDTAGNSNETQSDRQQVQQAARQPATEEGSGSHAEGRSVDELLAAYGSSAASGPHRRRRAQ